MQGKKKKYFNITYLPIITALVALVLTFVAVGYAYYLPPPVEQQVESYPEIEALRGNQMVFDDLKKYFQELADQKGAVYAFVVMNKAEMPFGTDMHLLAHSVGDKLFEQYGAAGMKYCTEDFRNACSHSIVINLFYQKGETAISDIMEACKKAPGAGAYDMCFHGLGHGVFAYTGYQLLKTVELCKLTATKERNEREYTECVGGAVMEQISGGAHDKVTWEKMRKINLRKDQPLYPCLGSVIRDQGPSKICLIYHTPYLWELAGRTSPIPSDDVLKRSFEYCDAIPLSDTESRDGCFGGFGKEFVTMAKGKDIRNIDKLTDQNIQEIYSWCLLTSAQDGQKACVLYAQGSIYWSGAIDKKYPEHFCSLAPTEELKQTCFFGLIGTVERVKNNFNTGYKEEFCNEIPENLGSECRKRLL